MIVCGLYIGWKTTKERKEAERQWEEAHKRHMEELDHLIAEGFKAEEEERKKKRGKK